MNNQPIRYQIFLSSDAEPHYESYTDYRIAVFSKIIPIPKVFDLKFEDVKEGEKTPQSGNVKFEYCDVDSRKIVRKDGELVVEIYGKLR